MHYPDPSPESIFDPILNMNSGKANATNTMLYPRFRGPSGLTKSERVELSLTQRSRLALELGMYSIASLSGSTSEPFWATLHAETHSSTAAGAADLLKHIRLLRYESELVLATPVTTQMASMAKCFLDIITASNCPVDIRGCFAHVEISQISAPIGVSLAYGSVSLLHTTGDVNAQAGPDGKIVFAGCRGNVFLKSGGGIDLKITANSFDGSMEATTRDSPIRILLPRGFLSSFEMIAPAVIVRADTALQAERHQTNDQSIVRYGADEPRLRFRSFQGPIVVDNPT